jgi:hypothetical protein
MRSPLVVARIAATLFAIGALVLAFGANVERRSTLPRGARLEAPVGESAEQVTCERSGRSENECGQIAHDQSEALATDQEGSETREASERAAGIAEPAIVGLQLDSPLVTGLVVLASLGLGAGVWRRPSVPWLLASVIALGSATGFFDVREIPFQLASGAGQLVGVAVAAAFLHIAAAVAAGIALREITRTGSLRALA